MDEMMRHQPSLRADTTKAIVKVYLECLPFREKGEDKDCEAFARMEAKLLRVSTG